MATIPTHPVQTSASDPALNYAMRQMAWYKRTGSRARFFHQAGEITVLLTTAATVVVAALHASAVVTATIAAVTLFLTGFRQVFGPNENWVRASRTRVAIEYAIVRYQLVPEAERDAAARRALMEQVIAICQEENSQWAAQQRRRAAGEVPHDRSAAISVEKP